MKKRVLAGVAVMAVATALVPIGGVQSTARANEQVVDASTISGTVMTDIGGQVEPVAGAEVTVWWIPEEHTAPVGSEVPIQTLTTTTTNADGSYDLSIVADFDMQRAARLNGGYLNFDVGVADADLGKVESSTVIRELSDTGTWSLPPTRTSEVDGDNINPNDPEAGDGTPDALRAPTSPSTRTTRLGPEFVLSADSPDGPGVAQSQASKKANRSKATALAAEDPVWAYCSYVVDSRPTHSVDIIEFHNAANSNARWTYGWAGDSDIDGAIDYSGDGGWKVSGSVHIGNNRKANVYRSYSVVANNYGTSDFSFTQGHYKPYGLGRWCTGTNYIPVNTKVKRAGSWVGSVGSNRNAGSEFIGCANTPQSTHRNNYPVGSGFARTTSSASKIAGAVDIGPIKVGAQSGFSTELDARWDALRGHGIWLCGTNNYPPTAGVIHAQNRP